MYGELIHTGVLGMKWGHRKSSGWATSADHQTARNLKGKHISEMSNEELRIFSSRMNLEKQYKEALRNDMHPGKKFAIEVLTSVGKQVATTMATDLMSKSTKKMISFAAERQKK